MFPYTVLSWNDKLKGGAVNSILCLGNSNYTRKIKYKEIDIQVMGVKEDTSLSNSGRTVEWGIQHFKKKLVLVFMHKILGKSTLWLLIDQGVFMSPCTRIKLKLVICCHQNKFIIISFLSRKSDQWNSF